MSNGTTVPIVQPQTQGPPWLLLIVGVLLALGVYRGPEIIRALGERNAVVVPDDKPVSKALFADKHCAEYFAGAAEHVAKIVEQDGKSAKPKLTKVEDVAEALAGAFCRSVLLGDLAEHGTDKAKLAKFVADELKEAGLETAGPLTPEGRGKLVAAWGQMAKSALEQVK